MFGSIFPHSIRSAQERLSYPIQKPVALLERIIAASSNERDVILDPFCGCGTSIHAAQKLNCKWIGIDITNLAISLIEKRVGEAFPGKKKGADSGIDGLICFKPDGEAFEKAIVSVKGGDNVKAAMIQDLAHVVQREKAQIGVMVTLAGVTKPMRTEAVKEGFYVYSVKQVPSHPNPDGRGTA